MRVPLRNVAVVEAPSPAEALILLSTEDLFVHVYVLVDDAITAGKVTIPARPGPTPACSDAEVLTIALVRHLLGLRSEAGFIAEVARDWAQMFPATAPVRGQPAHLLAVGRLRAAARRAGGPVHSR
jgi:hypothetical protein